MSVVDSKSAKFAIFWLSFVLLFGEVMAVRWLGIEVPVFRTFPNLVIMVVLVAASSGMAKASLSLGKKQSLLVGFATILSIALLVFAVPLGLPWLSIKLEAGHEATVVLALTCLFTFIVCMYVAFGAIGRLLGARFEQMQPLEAYSVNLLGSIAGVVAFGVVSWLSLGTWFWCAILGLAVFLLYRRPVTLVVTALLVGASFYAGHNSLWSPYSKLDVVPLAAEKGTDFDTGNYILNSNNHYFHFAVKILTEPSGKHFHSGAETSQAKMYHHYYRWLELPFELVPKRDQVLVLGSGSGNDVAYAYLRGNAQHVDAVEIDPVIARLGETLHPDKPYLDKRVTIHNEDARTFLRYAKDRYDLIQFAFLDPGATLNSASFLRVDNYVYTLESMQSALRLLKPDGVVCVTFATGAKSGVTKRLYQTIARANGSPPIAFVDDSMDSVIFLFGPGARQISLIGQDIGLRQWPQANEDATSNVCLDQWPFLYLTFDSSATWLYALTLLVAVVLPALALTRGKDGNITGAEWANMFFLGQAFMLVETKSITELALFFGATWIVSSVVILVILVLAWLATIIVSRAKPINVAFLYSGLAITLVFGYLWKMPQETTLHPITLALLACFIACLPIFFGSMTFATWFRRGASPSQFLAANLLGVAIGGLTENLCLVTGVSGLYLVALGLYALSWICGARAPSSAASSATQ